MSEQPVRRGWRGEAAGIPPARVPVPAAVPMSGTPVPPAPVRPRPTPRRRRSAAPVPPRPAAQPPGDFPLWPTSPVALHEARDAEAAGAHEDMRSMRLHRDERRTAPPRRRVRRVRPPRGAFAGLTWMLLLALLTGFFAWTSAEPFWLDIGRGEHGTAEVTSCQGAGLLRRCVATFAAPGRDPVEGARVMGLEAAPGASAPAEMLPGGRIAYAGHPSGLRVRWATGLGLVALCGLALSWLTGTWRLDRTRHRLSAWALTTAAPILLAAGIVLAAY